MIRILKRGYNSEKVEKARKKIRTSEINPSYRGITGNKTNRLPKWVTSHYPMGIR